MRSEPLSVGASTKQAAKLGAKISLWILGPLCILIWVAIIGGVFYKSASLGISPSEFLRLQAPNHSESETFLVLFARAMFGALLILVMGVVACTLAGAAIGAVVGFVERRKRKV